MVNNLRIIECYPFISVNGQIMTHTRIIWIEIQLRRFTFSKKINI
ncbi:unnamed protein product [Staphylococcus haemolyticus JCSC1435]|uniref:Uncharacterized protein n=1 Tax=Staphylococcus haemolyticus (strain JCSC1435) TaxID=279808 RepID=Q4L9C2_STAHJ|nr:unnamed protein product [Staphylococcus haemolyticus JCSC1435]